MHPDVARLLHDGHFREVADLQAHGPAVMRRPPRRSMRHRLALRLARVPHIADPRAQAQVTIRHACPRDEPQVERLAQLDERRIPAGRLIVAEVDRQIVAAAPLSGEPPVVNPFAATADVLFLLELRARQLAA